MRFLVAQSECWRYTEAGKKKREGLWSVGLGKRGVGGWEGGGGGGDIVRVEQALYNLLCTTSWSELLQGQ